MFDDADIPFAIEPEPVCGISGAPFATVVVELLDDLRSVGDHVERVHLIEALVLAEASMLTHND